MAAHIRRQVKVIFDKVSLPTCHGKKFRCTVAEVPERKDPLEYFLRKDVQTILGRITGSDPEQAFTPRKVYRARMPQYKALTDKELAKEMRVSKNMLKKRLQMPPFMDARKPRGKVLAYDKCLASVLDATYVFTDITPRGGRIKEEKDRPMVCRYKDGRLKEASWGVFERISQIYFPIKGREMFSPRLFSEKNLEELLDRDQDNYLYILERACVQYEPDDSEFLRITHRIYEHVCENHCFDCLRSTRFFGPMSFYFAWINKIEPLLADMVNKDLLFDAIDLINLKRMVHDQSVKEGDILPIIKEYYLEDSNHRYIDVLTKALDALDKRLEAKLQQKEVTA